MNQLILIFNFKEIGPHKQIKHNNKVLEGKPGVYYFHKQIKHSNKVWRENQGYIIFTSKSNIIIKFWRENQGYIIFTGKSNIIIKFWRKNQGNIFSRCHWNNFSRKHNMLGKASILKMRTSKSNYNKSFLKNKPVKKFAKMRKEFLFFKK